MHTISRTTLGVILALALALALSIAGCAGSGRDSAGRAPTSTSRKGVIAPEGFTSLFDGRTLKGWRPFVGSPPEVQKMDASRYAQALRAGFETLGEHWWVEDGSIVTDGAGQNLCTATEYADFELLVDWKIKPDGDSGIYLRGTPQVQIWDKPDIGSGGLYNNEKHESKPIAIADHPPGEWNTFRILMINDRVSVFLNDVMVVDSVLMENYWNRDEPIYKMGPIELQAHGNTVKFRNIFIRPIQ